MPSHDPSSLHAPSPSIESKSQSEVKPLPLHPQLVIHTAPLSNDDDSGSSYVEYRVYNHRRLGSGRVIRGDGWGVQDVLCIGGLSWTAWQASRTEPLGSDSIRRAVCLNFTSHKVLNSSLSCDQWLPLVVSIVFVVTHLISKTRTVLYRSFSNRLPGCKL